MTLYQASLSLFALALPIVAISAGVRHGRAVEGTLAACALVMRVLRRPVAPQPALGPRWQARSTPGTHHHTNIKISKETIDAQPPLAGVLDTCAVSPYIHINFLEKQKYICIQRVYMYTCMEIPDN